MVHFAKYYIFDIYSNSLEFRVFFLLFLFIGSILQDLSARAKSCKNKQKIEISLGEIQYVTYDSP